MGYLSKPSSSGGGGTVDGNAVLAAGFTGGFPYEESFQSKLDTIYNRSSSHLYRVNVSNSEVQQILLPNLTTVDDNFRFNICTNLTTLSAPLLTSAINIDISGNSMLTDLDLSSLNTPNPITISSNAIVTLDFPLLVSTSILVTNNHLMTDINLPSFISGGIDIESNGNVENILLPSFVGDGSTFLTIHDEGIISSLDVSALTTCGSGISLYNLAGLVSIDLSSLSQVSYSRLGIYDNPSLTSISVNPNLKCVNVAMQNCNLDVTTVDSLLAAIDNGNLSKFIHSGWVSGTYLIGDTITGGTSSATATVIYVDDVNIIYEIATGLFVAGETVTSPNGSAIIDSFDGSCVINGGTNASPTGGASNVHKLSLEAKGWTVTVS